MGLNQHLAAGTRPAPENRTQWYSIKNAAKSDEGPAELLIYDEIDSWFGVSAELLARDIAALDSERELTVRLNSPGGNIFDGIAILNAIRGHKGKVTTIVDGLAASAASFIAMGGDEVVMNRNAEMMIHKGHGIVIGEADDMRKQADLIDRLNENIAGIYAEKAGGTAEEWLATMGAETWYSAKEAVEAGLADRVIEPPKGGDDGGKNAKNRFDLSIFNHAGRSNAPAPRMPQAHNRTPQPVEAEAPNGKEPTVATLSESDLQKLGLDADADEAAISAKIAELTAPVEQAPPAEPSIDEATKVAAKFGMTVVNTAQYDQMAATVADLSARRDAAIQAENEAAITNALTTGRIDLKSADTWRGELAKNRESTMALLATLPENKAVPVDEIGHGVSREDQPENVEMAGVFAQVTGHTYGKDA